MEIKFSLSQLKKASKELKMHIKQNVVLISGEMGVGKTTLIKELLSLYGVIDNVSSPTFSIINEYLIDNDEVIYHMDLYRIKDIAELENIGFFEYIKSKRTCLIEWGEIIEEFIDSEYNKFTLIKKNNVRVLKKDR
ncbi:tRNA (adenosine(37)-N6)-threonylcarbamoyltransferase complex ATPase subunit type 1 TsaE [Flavobacteriaceae bacterium]|nr:tRNA (adenosine(37)-N6)-threonylcarbamoyltransferase complex ATPase subunit type 1 TsaE [Flavobacteriaceae bacterium]